MTTQHHTQPALPAQPTLQERRAHLRELMKRDDATVEDYHTVISGATEEERASLARTLSPTKLAKARGEKAALAAYAVGALTSSVPRAVRLISELFVLFEMRILILFPSRLCLLLGSSGNS